QVDPELARRCRLATPHIAGYSLDGKLRGTAQIYRAFCTHLGQSPRIELAELMPAPWLPELRLDAEADPRWALATLCRAVYDPRRDDADFRRSLVGDAERRRVAFDQLRKHYPMRRETDALQVVLTAPAPDLQAVLEALGGSWRYPEEASHAAAGTDC